MTRRTRRADLPPLSPALEALFQAAREDKDHRVQALRALLMDKERRLVEASARKKAVKRAAGGAGAAFALAAAVALSVAAVTVARSGASVLPAWIHNPESAATPAPRQPPKAAHRP
jgi:hypothetical protein